jgi:hypothetical protein
VGKLPNGKPKKSAGKIAGVVLAAVTIYNGIAGVLPANKTVNSILIGLTAAVGAWLDPRRKK